MTVGAARVAPAVGRHRETAAGGAGPHWIQHRSDACARRPHEGTCRVVCGPSGGWRCPGAHELHREHGADHERRPRSGARSGSGRSHTQATAPATTGSSMAVTVAPVARTRIRPPSIRQNGTTVPITTMIVSASQAGRLTSRLPPRGDVVGQGVDRERPPGRGDGPEHGAEAHADGDDGDAWPGAQQPLGVQHVVGVGQRGRRAPRARRPRRGVSRRVAADAERERRARPARRPSATRPRAARARAAPPRPTPAPGAGATYSITSTSATSMRATAKMYSHCTATSPSTPNDAKATTSRAVEAQVPRAPSAPRRPAG